MRMPDDHVISEAGSLLIPILFVIGMYGPSSTDGVFSQTTWEVYFLILISSVLFMLARKTGLGSPWRCVNSIGLVTVIILGTILSPFQEYRWGGLLAYLALALLFAMNCRNVSAQGRLNVMLTLANVVNIILGIAVVLDLGPVRQVFVDYYSAFYPELVEVMTSAGKPVLTFGTHSLAAFFFYLLFWMNFESYKAQRSYGRLLAALCYIVLGVFLWSFSAFALMGLAVLYMLAYAVRRHSGSVLVGLGAIAILGIVAVYRIDATSPVPGLAATTVSELVSSPTNGFFGRFSDSGTLHSTVQYMADRPFQPVGVGYRSDLFFGDNGPVEYYLRGSIGLVLAMYGGLFVFLRKNLVSRTDAYHAFALIVIFECGLTALCNIRVIYCLPVIVVFFNDLRRRGAMTGPRLGALDVGARSRRESTG